MCATPSPPASPPTSWPAWRRSASSRCSKWRWRASSTKKSLRRELADARTQLSRPQADRSRQGPADDAPGAERGRGLRAPAQDGDGQGPASWPTSRSASSTWPTCWAEHPCAANARCAVRRQAPAAHVWCAAARDASPKPLAQALRNESQEVNGDLLTSIESAPTTARASMGRWRPHVAGHRARVRADAFLFCFRRYPECMTMPGQSDMGRRTLVKAAAATERGRPRARPADRRLRGRLRQAREGGSPHRLHSADRLRLGGDGLGAGLRQEVRHQDHARPRKPPGPACATSWSTASSTWRTCCRA